MEMDVVLRTVLRELTLEPTTEPDEGWRPRGVAFAPAGGGRAVVCPRRNAWRRALGKTSATADGQTSTRSTAGA
jgi:hypothetical protein